MGTGAGAYILTRFAVSSPIKKKKLSLSLYAQYIYVLKKINSRLRKKIRKAPENTPQREKEMSHNSISQRRTTVHFGGCGPELRMHMGCVGVHSFTHQQLFPFTEMPHETCSFIIIFARFAVTVARPSCH